MSPQGTSPWEVHMSQLTYPQPMLSRWHSGQLIYSSIIHHVYTIYHAIYHFTFTASKYIYKQTDSKVHGANMGPIWGRQDQVGPILAQWTLLSGRLKFKKCSVSWVTILHQEPIIPYISTFIEERVMTDGGLFFGCGPDYGLVYAGGGGTYGRLNNCLILKPS